MIFMKLCIRTYIIMDISKHWWHLKKTQICKNKTLNSLKMILLNPKRQKKKFISLCLFNFLKSFLLMRFFWKNPLSLKLYKTPTKNLRYPKSYCLNLLLFYQNLVLSLLSNIENLFSGGKNGAWRNANSNRERKA